MSGEGPKFRSEVKDAVVGAIRDASRSTAMEWRDKAQIGDQVVHDCNVWGLSIWRRNEDGSVQSLDPSLVTIRIGEPGEILPSPPDDGTFTNRLVREQIARRNAKTTAEQRFQAGVEEVHQQFLAEKRSEWERPE